MAIEAKAARRELTGWHALAATLAGAAFTTICAQIGFHLPGNPIPVTLQVFAVILCGMALGGKLGALAQIEYLIAGAAGAPVFAGFKGGPIALAGPTGGYLVGFVIAAFVVGTLASRLSNRSYAGLCIAGFVGVVVIHLFGRAWFAIWLGDLSGLRSWALAVAPFVGIDGLKSVAAAAICGRRLR